MAIIFLRPKAGAEPVPGAQGGNKAPQRGEYYKEVPKKWLLAQESKLS
jgi:hypothetical protein